MTDPHGHAPATTVRRDRAFEIRFVVPRPLAAEILCWARRDLPADPHGGGPDGDEYPVTTLYFDTPAFDVFRRQRSFGRAKYRVRRYDAADGLFLERKLRTARIVAKRRSIVPLDALGEVLNGGSGERASGSWFSRRIAARRLQPVCLIAYRRAARQRFSSIEGPIRMTVDDDVRGSIATDVAFSAVPDVGLLDGHAVVELKYQTAAPALFKSLVERFGLNPDRFSKYRHAVAALRLTPAAMAVKARSR